MANDSISDDDKKLFRQTVGTVTPIAGRKKIPLAPDKPPVPPPKHTGKRSADSRPRLFLSDFIQEIVSGETVLFWSSVPLPSKRLREFKNGQLSFTARLDLHGLSTEQARENFLTFMDRSYRHDHRCVLIIHGKGGQQGNAPPIKNLLNRWLPQHPYVRAFHSAIPRHGGTGAVYVLLKKTQNLP